MITICFKTHHFKQKFQQLHVERGRSFPYPDSIPSEWETPLIIPIPDGAARHLGLRCIEPFTPFLV